ncbi:MAG: DUF4350 domain-containing protein [Myxococcota bacterium]
MPFLAAAGLVMFLTGLGSWYATGHHLTAFFVVNVTAGPTLIAIATVVQLRRFRGFTGAVSRRVMLRWAVVLPAIGVASVVSYQVASRHSVTFDLSFDQEYTLSDQTLRLCHDLGASASGVQLLFFEGTKLSRQLRPLVQAYRAHCPSVAIRTLVPRDAPPAAQQILNRYETTLVGCVGDRCEPVGYPSEGNITNSILRLTREKEIRVYFTIGHGEVDLASEADHGYSGLAAALRDEGIEPRGWIGAAQPEVPADADVVILAAPERNLLEGEISALDRYLERGGRLLALLEPEFDTNALELLRHFGFGLPPGVVVDEATSPLLEEARRVSLLVNSFGSHPISEPFSARTMLLLPETRAVRALHKPQPSDRLVELAYSSPRSWDERDVGAAIGGRPVRRDADEGEGGELPLAVAGSYPRPVGETRIVVLGSREFASNRLLGSLYNRDLFMNSVLWLAQSDRRIAIRPKAWTPFQYPLTVQQTLAYFYFLAFALPEVLLLLGLHAWYRQRI